jgi:stringent starvation protein B
VTKDSKTGDSEQGDTGQGDGSTRPYLIRAIYQWAIDHHLTPQILVDANIENVAVPLEYVEDGHIVLNIHPHSVKALEIGNEYLLFSARFTGKPFEVCVPVSAISAIYSRENGQGIVFQSDGSGQTPPPDPATDDDSTRPNDSKRPG